MWIACGLSGNPSGKIHYKFVVVPPSPCISNRESLISIYTQDSYSLLSELDMGVTPCYHGCGREYSDTSNEDCFKCFFPPHRRCYFPGCGPGCQQHGVWRDEPPKDSPKNDSPKPATPDKDASVDSMIVGELSPDQGQSSKKRYADKGSRIDTRVVLITSPLHTGSIFVCYEP